MPNGTIKVKQFEWFAGTSSKSLIFFDKEHVHWYSPLEMPLNYNVLGLFSFLRRR